jgi:hypothetical protein
MIELVGCSWTGPYMEHIAVSLVLGSLTLAMNNAIALLYPPLLLPTARFVRVRSGAARRLDEDDMTHPTRSTKLTLPLISLLCACAQPDAAPEPPAEPAQPYAVSDRHDPFEIVKLTSRDDPSLIWYESTTSVTVNDKTYSFEEFSELALEAMRDPIKDNGVFEISIFTNIYGRPYDAGSRVDKNFKEPANTAGLSRAIVNIDFLDSGHFYQCPRPSVRPAIKAYRTGHMFFGCGSADGELWVGFERDDSIDGEYKVPPKVQELVKKAIENTKIWNECHTPSEYSTVAPRYDYKALSAQKCMEDKGIHKTYMYVYYNNEKVTSYRIFTVNPYFESPVPGQRQRWRLVGELPYDMYRD